MFASIHLRCRDIGISVLLSTDPAARMSLHCTSSPALPCSAKCTHLDHHCWGGRMRVPSIATIIGRFSIENHHFSGAIPRYLNRNSLMAFATVRNSSKLHFQKRHVQCMHIAKFIGDVDGGGRHDVQDTMPTGPTRTKRGRTKKGEKDPPHNNNNKTKKTGCPPAA